MPMAAMTPRMLLGLARSSFHLYNRRSAKAPLILICWLLTMLRAVRLLALQHATHPRLRAPSLMWRQMLFYHGFIFPTSIVGSIYRECNGRLWHQMTCSWNAYDCKGWSWCLSKAFGAAVLTVSFPLLVTVVCNFVSKATKLDVV